jgi:hypothetical protein
MSVKDSVRWRKSSRSGGNGGACVELAYTLAAVHDSKNPNGPILRADLGALVVEAKSGRLGWPTRQTAPNPAIAGSGPLCVQS